MERSLPVCQADDCNYHKLEHDTAHRDSLMKAFIGWSTEQRHSLSVCASLHLRGKNGVGMSATYCVYLLVHLCVHESNTREVTMMLQRRGSLATCRFGFTTYLSVG